MATADGSKGPPAAPEAEAEGGARSEGRGDPADDAGREAATAAAAEDPDALLMARVREGDRAAFAALYERHFGPVARFAGQFLGNPARGEELAQEVFLQLYRARQRYEPRARFSTYLYTIAQNVCRNEVRRPEYRSRAETSRHDVAEESAFDPPDETGSVPSGEASASGGELAGRLRDLLAELPEAQRTALILSRAQELRYQEIAEILSCSEQAVKSLIFRATRRLREGLKEYLEEG